MAQKKIEEAGIWRKVGGQRIFIKEGEDLSTAMKNSGSFKKDKPFRDVTNEFYNEATPGKGNIDFENGYDKEKFNNEVMVANLIHKTFGGDIKLINSNNHQEDGKSPDFIWNNEMWELKSPGSQNSVSKRTEKGLHQISKNPGGIIIQINSNEMSIDDVIESSLNRYNFSGKDTSVMYYMIVVDNKIEKIYRYSH